MPTLRGAGRDAAREKAEEQIQRSLQPPHILPHQRRARFCVERGLMPIHYRLGFWRPAPDVRPRQHSVEPRRCSFAAPKERSEHELLVN
jgi:hypothetical protein